MNIFRLPKQTISLGLLLLAFSFPTAAQEAKKAAELPKVKADRWLEVDLYWFDREDIPGSVATFWRRCAPLFQGADGWRGVILNVGWTVDYVMDWRGQLDQKISFPVGFDQQSWFKLGGQLTGDTAERKRQWHERFAHPANSLKKSYGPWTYGELKQLAAALRQVAEDQYGLEKMRVGSFVLGWPEIYGGKSGWAAKHPDAFLHGAFNPGSLLPADTTAYGAFPKGIKAGTPVYEFFGKQWGSLSQAVGLDAIVLRDSILLPVQYVRSGPFGPVAPSPEKAAAWSQAAANLVRVTKQSNRKALVIGYSNAASAVADWRANCVDLETIAHAGYLDAWIDQTWAGAWNEVGTRENRFWGLPVCGWTYQLAYMLMHAAVLADTHVRHYHLAETFDAWESWDVIHTAPERLKWGMWAYSHAAVKTPQGLKFPAGTYISWANQGKRLISAADVKLLSGTLDAAYRDVAQVKEVYGPTLVYNREAMAWEMAHAAPDQSIKEWLDEQIGTVMKWPVPVLSATRLEWLPKVKSDLFFVQTPVHLSRKNQNALISLINEGQPVIAMGSPVGGLDPALGRLFGIEAASTYRIAVKTNAALAGPIAGITDGLPAIFPTFQSWSENRTVGDGQTIYNVDGSPALVLNTTDERRAAFWDPPEFIPEKGDPLPLREQLGGSVIPYVLVARTANLFLKENHALHAREIDPDETVAVAGWRLKNGDVQILAGNLEEGLREDAEFSRHATLVLPWKNEALLPAAGNDDQVGSGKAKLKAGNLTLTFGQAETGLFTLKSAE